MGRLTKKALLQHLNKSDKEDIIHEVALLFDKFKNVQNFYRAELSDTANPVLDGYKKKVHEAYCRPNPKQRTTNANINRLIKEFKKICLYDRELADLMLYRVECGAAAIKKNNKRSPTFYNCVLATFKDTLRLIMADGSLNEFKTRIDKAMKDAQGGKYAMGESMADVFLAFLHPPEQHGRA